MNLEGDIKLHEPRLSSKISFTIVQQYGLSFNIVYDCDGGVLIVDENEVM